MKEYWINVYLSLEGKYWFGNPHNKKWQAEMVANKHTIYRIHVRLK